MTWTGKSGLTLAVLAAGIAVAPAARAQGSMQQDSMKQDSMKQDSMKQDSMKQDSMKQDSMKQDQMKHDDMMHEEKAKTLYTGKFHGKVHKTEGRATVYQQADGKQVLRLTGFKTSNGPDVHVILVAVKDANDDANFLKSKTDRVELGSLKGNEGDQNYEIPAGTDLTKFTAVSVYCERFNANFGTAPLEKF